MTRESPSGAATVFHITGYLVFMTVAGASLGRRIAQVEPIDPLKRTARRLAEAQTLEQIIPFVLIGAVTGLMLGYMGERWLPDWKPIYWVYGIILTVMIWLTVGMPPWVGP